MDDYLHLVLGVLRLINMTVWRKLSDKEQRPTIVPSYTVTSVSAQAVSHTNRKKKAFRESARSRDISKFKFCLKYRLGGRR